MLQLADIYVTATHPAGREAEPRLGTICGPRHRSASRSAGLLPAAALRGGDGGSRARRASAGAVPGPPPPPSRVRVMSAPPGRKARWRDSAELHPDGRGAIRAQPQPELPQKPEPRGKINPSASPALRLSERPRGTEATRFHGGAGATGGGRAAALRPRSAPRGRPSPCCQPLGRGALPPPPAEPPRGAGDASEARYPPPNPRPSIAGGARRLGRKRRRHDVMRAAMLRFLGMGGCEGAIAAARSPPPAASPPLPAQCSCAGLPPQPHGAAPGPSGGQRGEGEVGERERRRAAPQGRAEGRGPARQCPEKGEGRRKRRKRPGSRAARRGGTLPGGKGRGLPPPPRRGVPPLTAVTPPLPAHCPLNPRLYYVPWRGGGPDGGCTNCATTSGGGCYLLPGAVREVLGV